MYPFKQLTITTHPFISPLEDGSDYGALLSVAFLNWLPEVLWNFENRFYIYYLWSPRYLCKVMSWYTQYNYVQFLRISQNKLPAWHKATPEALATYDSCTEIELYEILDTQIQSSQDIIEYNTKLVEILIC